mmetsp:Transcript_15521/g.15093  ORF Transcript_15521/g.15093 Transcript_15521/m.15093 type:complete len:106 (+) Transcript_15521:1358-1675(+)
MAGYTGFSVGMVRDTVTFIPVKTLKERGMNRVDMEDRQWLRLMSLCNQSPMLNTDETKKLAQERIRKQKEDINQVVASIKKRVKANFNRSYAGLALASSKALLLD